MPVSSASLPPKRASLHSLTHPARLLHLLPGLLLIAISVEMHTVDPVPVSLPIQRPLIPPRILSAQPWDVRRIKQFARSLFPALLQSIPQENKKPISFRCKSSKSSLSSKRLSTASRALPAPAPPTCRLASPPNTLRTVSELSVPSIPLTHAGVVPSQGPCTCCLVRLECSPSVLFKTVTVQIPHVTS